MQAEIYDIDYNRFVHILGTTHFSTRSLCDAYKAAGRLKPTDLAIELDTSRYQVLNDRCATCPKNKECGRKCEFIGAVEAMENKDANIWLIDMSKSQFQDRIQHSTSLYPHWRVLLNERDTLMAARLAWIATEALKADKAPRVLALVGAAHLKGIESLLTNPLRIRQNLRRLNLTFTPPELIRRIGIKGD